MKKLSKISIVLLGTLLLASVAQADLLTTFTTSIAANDPTQLGRISRNGIPSDWSSVKAFPGVINPTTTYNYHTYTINSGVTPYIFITMDSVAANTFASAYMPGYDPNNLAFNYIGDAGSSGNYFGVDPISFEVYVPARTDFLIVVNTSANAGIGQPFTITVQGFIDDQFTPTPEPSSMLLLGSGVLGIAGVIRRKMNLG
jgi:PEP-CTERM motif